MLLKDYIKEYGIVITHMAEKLDVHRNYLFMLISGKRRPSIHVARRIEDLTSGKVKVDDLIERTIPERCPCCGKKINRYG